ncbi:MAG: malate dehydrogenase, partial [Candidatus Omnitrophica bacterium]|nr:malate dehydrogenase [Candidatus Omnitrophota bacterium]
MRKIVRVAVTGSSGKIGYHFIFRLVSGEVFGPGTELDVRLYDLPAALPALDEI